MGGHLVDAFVSALRREQHCDQEGVGVLVLERCNELGIEPIEQRLNPLGLFFAFHGRPNIAPVRDTPRELDTHPIRDILQYPHKILV